MSALVRPSPAEVEAQIAAARDWLDGTETNYQRQRYTAVIDTLTWALHGGRSPLTGSDYGPISDDILFSESYAAHSAEQQAIGNGEDSTRPGCIYEALEFVRGLGEEPVD
jgi:hypothetical protein